MCMRERAYTELETCLRGSSGEKREKELNAGVFAARMQRCAPRCRQANTLFWSSQKRLKVGRWELGVHMCVLVCFRANRNSGRPGRRSAGPVISRLSADP